MKTRLIFFSVALIICGLGYFQQRNREARSELLLSNIEALANDENVNADCIGIGSVDCPINSDKVLYVF